MKKLAFIVEREFVNNHFGVRNFFSTIKSTLSEEYETDFLIHVIGRDTVLWFKVVVEYIPTGEKENYLEFEVDKEANKWNYSTINNFILDYPNNMNSKLYFRAVGEHLKMEKYDIAFITNPWTIDYNLEIDANYIVGMLYDFIPNQYSLTKPTYDFTLANNHRKGYEYYNKYCDKIIADSKACADDYKKYYPNVDEDRITYFPPFVPYEYKNIEYRIDLKKENSVILAAPFDSRKGIEEMPELINGVSDIIETLYIFGMPRCEPELVNKFFKELKVKHIVYYPYISYEALSELYMKSKILLFPSHHEGLGLPLLEAQVCGCRILTTDKEPMNQLGVLGYGLLTEKKEENIQKFRSMMIENDFEFNELSKLAKNRFLYEEIHQIVENIFDSTLR